MPSLGGGGPNHTLKNGYSPVETGAGLMYSYTARFALAYALKNGTVSPHDLAREFPNLTPGLHAFTLRRMADMGVLTRSNPTKARHQPASYRLGDLSALHALYAELTALLSPALEAQP